MTTGPTCIIAYASEHDKYPALGKLAIETAQSAHAKLILYDIDAATLFTSPTPTVWSGGGTKDEMPHMLLPEDLEAAGRGAIARQVESARSAGVDAYGWLPDTKGSDGLASYADEVGADLIMLPQEFAEPSLFAKLRGASADAAVKETHRPIVVVQDNGESAYQ
ncbi:MAG: hypothetical protein ABIP13_03460 [Tepidiformaceae bacterium]